MNTLTMAVILVLTAASACLIVVSIRQQEMMEQRVRFFVGVTATERLLGELHILADEGKTDSHDALRIAAQVDRHLDAMLNDSGLFEELQPQIADHLGRVHQAMSTLDGGSPARLFVATNDSFMRMHMAQDLAGRFYADRMRRYGVIIWTLAALLSGACLLLLFLAMTRRKSEWLIRRLDRDLRSLMESVPIVLLTVSRRGMVQRWNARLARLTGAHTQRPLTELFPRDSWPALHIALETARQSGESESDLPLLLPDGSTLDMAWAFYARGADVTMAGRDISDRVAAQRELGRTAARHRELFEQIRDAALITEYGKVVDINSAGLELFGYSRELMNGMPLNTIVADENDVPQFIRALRGGPVIDYELRLLSSTGRVLDCLITATARFDERGTLIGCQGLARDVTERQRMLEALRESEREYRGLFEHAYDPIVVLDPVTEEILDANDQACLMYDFPRNELVGRSMESLSVNPERGKEMLRKTREATGRFWAMESQQYRRDGTVMQVEINATEVWYSGRRAILSMNRDVTKRRAVERARRESEERFRLLLESVTDHAIFMLDPEGKVVSWNEGAERITGYAASEILGRQTTILFLPEDAEEAESELRVAAAEGRAAVEGWRVRKDGSRFYAAVTVTPIREENGDLRGFAKITRDITELKRYESTQQEIFNTVQNVAAEWTQTFDAVQVPIVLLEGEGKIRRLNRAAQRLSNMTFQDLLRRPVMDLPGEPWQTISRLARYAHDFGRSAESRAIDFDSGAVWQVSTSVTDVGSADRLVTAIAYDLTLVTRLEESLRQTEIAATLGAIVGGVAHEVRNPLFTISATLDAWEARLGETPHLERYMVPLRNEVGRLNRLMSDLLEYGKPHPLVVHPAPIAVPIAAAVSDCRVNASARGVRITTSFEEGLPEIPIDSGRLEQVFLNVIDNAVQHSPEGGVVHVDVKSAGETVTCTIIDEGRGLQPDDVDRVFEPFFTRRKGGTGLGLPISRKIVLAHHGEISIGNRTDAAGAVVTIVLPSRGYGAAGTGAHENTDDLGRRRGAAADSTA